MSILLKNVFTSVLLVLALYGCTGLPKIVNSGGEAQGIAKAGTIYVVNHGWHTGVVLETDKLLNTIPSLAPRFSGSRFIEVGWGDAGFYQATEITLGLIVNAVFKPTDSVVHVVGLDRLPHYYFTKSEIIPVSISSQGYARLLQFLRNSFAQNQVGGVISLKAGVYGDSQFFAGKGQYYLFNTCNTWTAKALRSAGIPIRVRLKLTAGGVMNAIASQHKK